MFAEVPPRVEYEITAAAQSMRPIFKAILEWVVDNPASLSEATRQVARAGTENPSTVNDGFPFDSPIVTVGSGGLHWGTEATLKHYAGYASSDA